MATKSKPWTLDELHRLPEDGNKYELVRGALFVSPAPSVAHESIAEVLSLRLHRYVEDHTLGRVARPRSVIQALESETEPDLMVRPVPATLPESWAAAPLPILVVEIVSPTTRRRDFGPKRDFYMDIGVPEYWIVDGDARTIRVVRPGRHDVVTNDTLVWSPPSVSAPLGIDVRTFFTEALGSDSPNTDGRH